MLHERLTRAGIGSVFVWALCALQQTWTGDDRWGTSALVFIGLALILLVVAGISYTASDKVQADAWSKAVRDIQAANEARTRTAEENR